MFILVLFYFYVVISPTKCDKHFLISFEKKNENTTEIYTPHNYEGNNYGHDIN